MTSIPPDAGLNEVPGSSEPAEDTPEIHIVMADGWKEVDLDPTAVDETIEELFGDLEDRDQIPFQRSYEAYMRAGMERARQQGAVAMLQFLARTDDDDPQALVASLVIFLQPLTEPLAEMASTLAPDKEQKFLDLGHERRALRVSQLSHTVLPGIKESIAMHTVRYYQELDGSPFTAILAYGTPNVPLADEFTEMFDEMASTFRITLPEGAMFQPGTPDAETRN